MSVSGVTTYNQTTSELITDAFLLLTIIAPYESVSPSDYAIGLRFLNDMVKSWQAGNIYLSTETEAHVYLNVGQVSYNLGGSSPDKAGNVDGTIETNISSSAILGDTTLTVTSVTGCAVNQTIGILLDSGSIQWSTILTVDSVNNILTINDPLTGPASIPATVWAYTTPCGRPLDVSSARYVWDDTTVQWMRPLSRKMYFLVPGRTTSQGTPVQYYLDCQRDYSRLYLYPAPDTSENRIQISYRRIIDDFVNTGDIADLPQMWIETLKYNLACRLAPVYDKMSKINEGNQGGLSIASTATALLRQMKGWDQEKHADLNILPYVDYYDGD